MSYTVSLNWKYCNKSKTVLVSAIYLTLVPGGAALRNRTDAARSGTPEVVALVVARVTNAPIILADGANRIMVRLVY